MKKHTINALCRCIPIFFLLAILSLCASCGSTKNGNSAEGPLTLNEISDFESMYWSSMDEVAERLSLSESDIEFKDDFGLVPAQRRTLASLECAARYDFSAADPMGLYMLSYHPGTETNVTYEDTEKFTKVFNILYDEAKKI